MARRDTFLEVVLKNSDTSGTSTTSSSTSGSGSGSSTSSASVSMPVVPVLESPPIDISSFDLPQAHPFITFDVEYDRLLKSEDTQGDAELPRITCIAAVTCEGCFTFWHGGYHERSGTFHSHMNEQQIQHFVDFLWSYFQKGYIIVTWGGTAFDFRVLYHEVKDPFYKSLIHFLCRRHVDVPLTGAATAGMMMGLSAVSRGMGLGSKPFDSSRVPFLWSDRSSSMGQEAVLRQVWTDAALTTKVYNQIFINGCVSVSFSGAYRPYLEWFTMGGKIRRFYTPFAACTPTTMRLWNVEECMVAPKPVTPFPPNPNMTVDACTKWLYEVSITSIPDHSTSTSSTSSTSSGTSTSGTSTASEDDS